MEEVKKLSRWDEAKSRELYRKIKAGLVKLSQKETWLFEAGKIAASNHSIKKEAKTKPAKGSGT